MGQFDILSFFFSTTYINNEVMDVMDKCLFVMDGIDGFLKQKKLTPVSDMGHSCPVFPSLVVWGTSPTVQQGW